MKVTPLDKWIGQLIKRCLCFCRPFIVRGAAETCVRACMCATLSLSHTCKHSTHWRMKESAPFSPSLNVWALSHFPQSGPQIGIMRAESTIKMLRNGRAGQEGGWAGVKQNQPDWMFLELTLRKAKNTPSNQSPFASSAPPSRTPSEGQGLSQLWLRIWVKEPENRKQVILKCITLRN